MEGVISPFVCALSRSVEGKGEKRDLIESRVQFPEGGRTHPSSTSLSLSTLEEEEEGDCSLPYPRISLSEARGGKEGCLLLLPSPASTPLT